MKPKHTPELLECLKYFLSDQIQDALSTGIAAISAGNRKSQYPKISVELKNQMWNKGILAAQLWDNAATISGKVVEAAPELLDALILLKAAIENGDPGDISDVLLMYGIPAIEKATK